MKAKMISFTEELRADRIITYEEDNKQTKTNKKVNLKSKTSLYYLGIKQTIESNLSKSLAHILDDLLLYNKTQKTLKRSSITTEEDLLIIIVIQKVVTTNTTVDQIRQEVFEATVARNLVLDVVISKAKLGLN